jgi:hypothetical protein
MTSNQSNLVTIQTTGTRNLFIPPEGKKVEVPTRALQPSKDFIPAEHRN